MQLERKMLIKYKDMDIHILLSEETGEYFIPLKEICLALSYKDTKQIRIYMSSYQEIGFCYLPNYVLLDDNKLIRNLYGKGVISLRGIHLISTRCQDWREADKFFLEISKATSKNKEQKEAEFVKLIESLPLKDVMKALAVYMFSEDEEKFTEILTSLTTKEEE